MKKRILIPYASYGNGHKSIALYIKKYFEENGEYECLTLDLISYSIPFIGKISRKTTDFIMTTIPELWSFIYYSFNNKLSAYVSGKISLKMFDNKKLKQTIKEFNPDITIATHFFGSDIINKYNKKGITNSKLITVVTDYYAHEFWLNSLKNTDTFIVSSLEEKFYLLKKGFKNKQIETSGIPLSPDMNKNLNMDELKIKFKIKNKKKTILFFAGGSNGSLINFIYFKEILKNNYDCNILFVAGKDKKVEKLARDYVKKYKNPNIHIYGFVNNINEFYYVSDFVITKPGGAQVTECLLFNKPMLLVKGNGGQEIENRKYLIRKGYAKRAKNKETFNNYFKEMLYNEKSFNKMKNKISKNEQSKSMEKLYKIVEKLI